MNKTILIIGVSISFLFTSILFINNTNAKEDLPLQYRVVVIDPGHGGFDNGADAFGYKEDDLNLQISKRIKKQLETLGASVYLTRSGDYDMTKRNHHYSKQDDMYLRVKEIDKYKAHYLLSIHLNYSLSASSWGSQVFYYHNSENAKKLATFIDTDMKEVTNSRKPISGCGFRVLRATKTLGVLIECGFMSNYNECGQLRSSNYQKKLASAISSGLVKYDKKSKEIQKENIEEIIE